MTYAVRVGIAGLAASPSGSCIGGDSGQGSRPGQRLVHLDQSCPDHPLDVACRCQCHVLHVATCEDAGLDVAEPLACTAT